MIEFFIPGIPAPGGSKSAFRYRDKKTGQEKIAVTGACKRTKQWRSDVKTIVKSEYDGDPLDCPVVLVVVFRMPRPKGHYGTGRNLGKLKPSAPLHHTVKPDATKLMRALEDSLTGVLWRDDAQVIAPIPIKRYCDADSTPGARVRIYPVRASTLVNVQSNWDVGAGRFYVAIDGSV